MSVYSHENKESHGILSLPIQIKLVPFPPLVRGFLGLSHKCTCLFRKLPFRALGLCFWVALGFWGSRAHQN